MGCECKDSTTPNGDRWFFVLVPVLFVDPQGDLSLSVNPFGFLSALHIRNKILLNPDWSIPQVTMDLIGGEKN